MPPSSCGQNEALESGLVYTGMTRRLPEVAISKKSYNSGPRGLCDLDLPDAQRLGKAQHPRIRLLSASSRRRISFPDPRRQMPASVSPFPRTRETVPRPTHVSPMLPTRQLGLI